MERFLERYLDVLSIHSKVYGNDYIGNIHIQDEIKEVSEELKKVNGKPQEVRKVSEYEQLLANWKSIYNWIRELNCSMPIEIPIPNTDFKLICNKNSIYLFKYSVFGHLSYNYYINDCTYTRRRNAIMDLDLNLNFSEHYQHLELENLENSLNPSFFINSALFSLTSTFMNITYHWKDIKKLLCEHKIKEDSIYNFDI